MPYFKFVLCLALSQFSCAAFATMYFAAFDRATGQTALVYSSSGGNFWQTLVKGKGLAGAQNYGLCKEATPRIFFEQGLSAPEVVARVKAQCDAADYHAYRFLAVTPDGNIDYVIGRDGCSIPDCGARRGENFVVTGGGLQPGVLDAAVAAYEAQDPKLTFTCRLYGTLTSLYASGGQINDFVGASITVDNPARPALLHVQTDIFDGGGQQDLLQNLKAQLLANGEACDSVSN